MLLRAGFDRERGARTRLHYVMSMRSAYEDAKAAGRELSELLAGSFYILIRLAGTMSAGFEVRDDIVNGCICKEDMAIQN